MVVNAASTADLLVKLSIGNKINGGDPFTTANVNETITTIASDMVPNSEEQANFLAHASVTVANEIIKASNKLAVKAGDSLTPTVVKKDGGGVVQVTDAPTILRLSSDNDTETSIADFSAPTAAESGTLLKSENNTTRFGVIANGNYKPNGSNSYDGTASRAAFVNQIRSIAAAGIAGKNTMGDLLPLRSTQEDVIIVLQDSANRDVNWDGTQWVLVSDPSTTSAPINIVAKKLEPTNSNYAVYSNQASRSEYTTPVAPASNSDLIVSLDTVYQVSAEPKLFSNFYNAVGSSFTATEAVKMLAKDNSENGTSITPSEFALYNRAMSAGQLYSYADFVAVNSAMGGIIYRANAAEADAVLATHTLSESVAVSTFASLLRENLPNYFYSSNGRIRIAVNKANNASLGMYWSYLISPANRQAGVYEAATYHADNGISTPATNIYMQEQDISGAWGDLTTMPVSAPAGAIRFLNNDGDLAHNQGLIDGAYQAADKMMLVYTNYQPLSSFSAAAFTTNSLDWSLVPVDIFNSANPFVAMVQKVAAAKKNVTQTADNYINSVLLTNTLTANALPAPNAWAAFTEGQQWRFKVFDLFRQYNALNTTTAAQKVDFLTTENLTNLRNIGALIAVKTNATDAHPSVYLANSAFQGSGAPNQTTADALHQVSVAERIVELYGLQSPHQTSLLTSAYASDSVPYDAGSNLSIANGNSVVSKVGLEAIRHIAYTAYDSNNVAAGAVAITTSAYPFGSTDAQAYVESRNLMSFFMQSSGAWTSGTSVPDVTRVQMFQQYVAFDRAGVLNAIGHYLEQNQTANTYGDLAGLLKNASDLVPEIQADKTKIIGFIAAWTANTTHYSYPVMKDASGATIADGASILGYFEDPARTTLSFSAAMRNLGSQLAIFLSHPDLGESDIPSCFTRGRGQKDMVLCIATAQLDADKKHMSIAEVQRAMRLGVSVSDISQMALQYVAQTGDYTYGSSVLEVLIYYDIEMRIVNA
jgi:hypothetical protein